MRRILLFTGVLALAAGGVAWAAIPDSGNVYHACMLKATGTVRLIDPALPSSNLLGHCTQLEREITWNQEGPPGTPGRDGVSVRSADAETIPSGTPASATFDSATGNIHLKIPQGDKGEKGDQGDPGTGSGTPDVFKGGCQGCGAPFGAGGGVTIATLTLPVGHYAVWAKLRVFNSHPDPASFNCFLRSGSTTVDDAESLSIPSPQGTTASMEAVVDVTTAAPDNIDVRCGTTATGLTLTYAAPKLIAIPVGTIDDQST